MLLEAPIYKEIFGSVVIHEAQKVLKMDSETNPVQNTMASHVLRQDLYDIISKMAIVIPIKDEKLMLLDGVLRAISDQCPVIIVSNSSREAPNNYKQEMEMVKQFYNITNSRIVMVHQKDTGLAKAFADNDYNDILDEEGNIRNGKGEGMIIGIMLAKSLGMEYLGFIDADNYIPGSANEYVKDYAFGFAQGKSDYKMVRLLWRHKPKIVKRKLYFRKKGRVSEITNRYLNILIGQNTGFETDIINTGNAGEHAMSIKLADIIAHSTGYSIEPYQLVYLFEKFGMGDYPEDYKHVSESEIEIYQIETLNPHIHEEKGEEHINDMIILSIGCIYHSEVIPEGIKKQVIKELKSIKLIKTEAQLIKPRIMNPIGNINLKKWTSVFEKNAQTLIKFG